MHSRRLCTVVTHPVGCFFPLWMASCDEHRFFFFFKWSYFEVSKFASLSLWIVLFVFWLKFFPGCRGNSVGKALDLSAWGRRFGPWHCPRTEHDPCGTAGQFLQCLETMCRKGIWATPSNAQGLLQTQCPAPHGAGTTPWIYEECIFSSLSPLAPSLDFSMKSASFSVRKLLTHLASAKRQRDAEQAQVYSLSNLMRAPTQVTIVAQILRRLLRAVVLICTDSEILLWDIWGTLDL